MLWPRNLFQVAIWILRGSSLAVSSCSKNKEMNTERTHDSVTARIDMGSSRTLGSWQHTKKRCFPPCCRFANGERNTQPHNHTAVDSFKTLSIEHLDLTWSQISRSLKWNEFTLVAPPTPALVSDS